MHSIKNLISILWQEYKFVRFMRKSKPPQKEFRNEWNEKKGVPVGFDQGAWECWYRKRNRCPCCPWQKRKQKMSGANSAPANQCNRNTGWTLIEIQGCCSPAFFSLPCTQQLLLRLRFLLFFSLTPNKLDSMVACGSSLRNPNKLLTMN